MRKYRVLFGAGFIGLVCLSWYLAHMYGLSFSFEELRATRMNIEKSLMDHPLLGALSFSIIYIGAVALSLPIATALTVLSGFLFGSIFGTIIVTISATAGATIIFILARFFFREYFASKFGPRLASLDQEFSTRGFFGVLVLRLMPVVPFVLINVGAGLTKVRVRDYMLATLVGIMPFTFVYVQAGTRLAELRSLSDVLSFKVLLTVSLLVLAVALPSFIQRYRKRVPAASR